MKISTLAMAIIMACSSAKAWGLGCDMNFYVTNNTDYKINVEKIWYKHENSSWDWLIPGTSYENIKSGEQTEYVGDLDNLLFNCKKKRKARIRAKCVDGGGGAANSKSGWLKDDGESMHIVFQFDECPSVQDAYIYVWDD